MCIHGGPYCRVPHGGTVRDTPPGHPQARSAPREIQLLPRREDPRAPERAERQQIVLVAGDEDVGLPGLRHRQEKIVRGISRRIDDRELLDEHRETPQLVVHGAGSRSFDEMPQAR